MSRGVFILLEGVDRCGKTTQVGLLSESSVMAPCEKMNFPDRTTEIGKTINSYLKSSLDLPDESVHLLFSSNRWERQPHILECLQGGKNIVCDRYAYSGVAFTNSKVDGPALDWCKACDVGLPRPDAILFLDVSQSVAETRGGFGDERYENTTHQTAVRKVFETLKTEDQAMDNAPEWHMVDAGRSIQEVKKDIEEIVKGVKERKQDTPIGKLWSEGNY
ncbi:hypothetical protein TrST_g7398 [Triparma strigata]|uniref:Thymidylate kinase n=1 Tax=Triparma strigata TaxID=1606541 RepID=A0A9W7ABI3_9STRA|nr:hypothetical protein TrST_g7398 [Triparma strigata]